MTPFRSLRQNVKRILRFLPTFIVLISLLLSVGLAAADDGEMFRKNVSKTPDLETEHAALRMLPLYVPAQSSDGTLLTEGIEYTNADGALVETRYEARPLIAYYIDGHVEAIDEEGYGGFPGHGERDAFAAVSLDDGATWLRTNLSNSAELSSINVRDGNRWVPYAGDVGRTQRIRVSLIDLAPPYDQFNGRHMWVGEPVQTTESPAQTAPGQGGFADFWTAKLECDKPAFSDWTTLTGDCLGSVCYHSENAGAACVNDADCVPAILHVYSEFIVPESRYEIRMVDSSCLQFDAEDDAVSPPLTTDAGPSLATSVWGDTNSLFIDGAWTASDGSCLVPRDVIAVLSKVALGPLSKTRADVIGPENPKNMQPDLVVDLTKDVIRVLSACGGRPFPADPPTWPCQ